MFTRKKQTSRWKHGGEQASSLLKHSRGSSWSTLGEHEAADSSKNTVLTSPPSYREVFSPQSNLNLLTYSLLALHSMAYDQLLPVFLHLPPQTKSSPQFRLPLKFAGGFGLDVSHTSLSVLHSLWQQEIAADRNISSSLLIGLCFAVRTHRVALHFV